MAIWRLSEILMCLLFVYDRSILNCKILCTMHGCNTRVLRLRVCETNRNYANQIGRQLPDIPGAMYESLSIRYLFSTSGHYISARYCMRTRQQRRATHANGCVMSFITAVGVRIIPLSWRICGVRDVRGFFLVTRTGQHAMHRDEDCLLHQQSHADTVSSYGRCRWCKSYGYWRPSSLPCTTELSAPALPHPRPTGHSYLIALLCAIMNLITDDGSSRGRVALTLQCIAR
jgi:hypothetical protein